LPKEIGSWGKPPPASPSGKPATDSNALITPLLQPGEQLIWHANGRGPHWIGRNIYAAVFLPVWLALISYGLATSILKGEISSLMIVYVIVITVGVTIGVGWGIVHAIFSPSHDAYGLTDRRVIVVSQFLGRRERSYDASRIKVLRIRDGATGDITFWTQPSRYVNRAWAIVGVSNPRQIADLIRTTLKLDLPITDGVKPKEKLYIPPLDPRRPD
jgi:hypothetical protein